jgi:deoxyguanosine kinase
LDWVKIERATFVKRSPPHIRIQMSTQPILISIEGNIGSGKSTLLKRLRELQPNWTFVDEPVDSWLTIRNEQGESLLEVFYKDIKRWAYTFQNAAVLSRGQMVQKAVEEWKQTYSRMLKELAEHYHNKREEPVPNVPSRIILMERCVETDRNVFAKMLKADGKMDGIEWILYEKWYNFIIGMVPKINAFIWVDTEADTCSQRIKTRAREGEDDIPLEYLKNLEKVHKEWLEENKESQVFRSQSVDEIRKFINSLDV